MTGLVLDRSDVKVLLWHLALYGLAAICEDAGVTGVRVTWTPGIEPRARLDTELASRQIADLVHAHAAERAGDASWLRQDLPDSNRGLMSPRHTAFVGRETWRVVQQTRHRVLDQLTEQRSWLDLQLLAALGEPCYWSRNRQEQTLQDDGASRFEMQARNQGSELVGSKLRKLVDALSARTPDAVHAGLTGARVHDEVGKNKADSRTATGLAGLGPTDTAVAWCALWGISQLPIAQYVNRRAATAGHIGKTRKEWFYLPVWHRPWRPARLRSILVSRQLGTAAAVGLPEPWTAPDAKIMAARSWLDGRGVQGIIRFPIDRFGSDSAPERRAMRGRPLPVRQP